MIPTVRVLCCFLLVYGVYSINLRSFVGLCGVKYQVHQFEVLCRPLQCLVEPVYQWERYTSIQYLLGTSSFKMCIRQLVGYS